MPILFVPILYMPISFVRTKEIGERKAAGVPPDPAAERIFKMRSGDIYTDLSRRDYGVDSYRCRFIRMVDR